MRNGDSSYPTQTSTQIPIDWFTTDVTAQPNQHYVKSQICINQFLCVPSLQSTCKTHLVGRQLINWKAMVFYFCLILASLDTITDTVNTTWSNHWHSILWHVEIVGSIFLQRLVCKTTYTVTITCVYFSKRFPTFEIDCECLLINHM